MEMKLKQKILTEQVSSVSRLTAGLALESIPTWSCVFLSVLLESGAVLGSGG
jgi:hypothetical protein